MPNVVLCGYRMWSRTDVVRVAFRRACRFVETVLKKAIIATTISICFCRKRVAPAIVATHRWWKPKDSVAIMAFIIMRDAHRCPVICWWWPKRLCHVYCYDFCTIFVTKANAIATDRRMMQLKRATIIVACSWNWIIWANWCEMLWRKRCSVQRWVHARQWRALYVRTTRVHPCIW